MQLISLKQRRLRGDITEVYKLVTVVAKMNGRPLVSWVEESKCRGHRFTMFDRHLGRHMERKSLRGIWAKCVAQTN